MILGHLPDEFRRAKENSQSANSISHENFHTIIINKIYLKNEYEIVIKDRVCREDKFR